MTDNKWVQGHRARLKERFDQTLGQGMPDYEILELLLFSAIPRMDVKPLAKDLLENFKSLSKVLSASDEELKAIKGIGPQVVHLFKLLHALNGRLLSFDLKKNSILQNRQQVVDYCRLSIGTQNVEMFMVFYLDSHHHLLHQEVHQKGTVTHATVYPREIIKKALSLGACGLVLVHNHPSGDLTPSQEDIDLTYSMHQIGFPLGISVHDHIIVSDSEYVSFKEKGWF